MARCPSCGRTVKRGMRKRPRCGLRRVRTRRQKVAGLGAVLVGLSLFVVANVSVRSDLGLASNLCALALVVTMGGILILIPYNWAAPMSPTEEKAARFLAHVADEMRRDQEAEEFPWRHPPPRDTDAEIDETVRQERAREARRRETEAPPERLKKRREG